MLASSLLYGLLTAASISTATAYHHAKSINHTVITGIFLQDDTSTNASTFNFTASNFGLINRPYPSDPSCPNQPHSTQWQRLSHYITTLNQHAPKHEHYTLFFLGRHGEGVHNAAETYFGTPAWNCYWSERDGNQTATWADAKLTDTGKQQALRVNRFWKTLIKEEKISPPETFYTSPLYRCLDTARLTFQGVDLPRKRPFAPVIKEFLREGISAHSCDRRHGKSFIRKNFPGFTFEKGFVEEDPYWTAGYAEPQADQDARSKAVLDDITSSDGSAYISITSHSGEIGSLLRGMYMFWIMWSFTLEI
ncbi:Histidine phosphatase superfamily clade-1 [Pyrenophora seminiperda CCB06]|uniref:Histidine phosphatase superfamily clade-1 n=1 Tax=Pyrenophora seminiperda CCB06 TaxID=1302712 RepID=A0A3M7M4L3_9PLEO|nr:Histidine phosphatase superfamily clade-1 [Pyrenophora seminiperda CCB06]